MRTHLDAKSMAKSLKADLAKEGLEIPHGRALDLVARQFGLKDWNVLSAKIDADPGSTGSDLKPAIPIFRIFDEEKARAFYIDYLGCSWDWEHRFHNNAPLYAQVSRAGMVIHLSEHHGDASPAATAYVVLGDVDAFVSELRTKTYRHLNPGIDEAPWGRGTQLTDPFGNRIRFNEPSV